MKFSGLAIISAMTFLSAQVMANPVSDVEANPIGLAPVAAKYKIECTGGQHADAKCTNGKKTDGCRCDSKGTYLCDPSSLAKSGGQCAKCGCE